MKVYRTMILDSDTSHLENLTRCFSQFPRIRIIATLTNGIEALDKILEEKPDLLLMDLLVPGLDGLSLLKELQKMKDPPSVVCQSDFCSKTSIEVASRYGAIYFLIKPIDGQSVVSTLLECADTAEQDRKATEEASALNPEDELAAQIQVLMKRFGFSLRYLGSTYLAEAVMLVHKSPMYIGNLNTGLYPELAKIEHTTPSCVERSLRTAIAAADADKSLTDILGSAPTNKTCIQLLLNELRR